MPRRSEIPFQHLQPDASLLWLLWPSKTHASAPERHVLAGPEELEVAQAPVAVHVHGLPGPHQGAVVPHAELAKLRPHPVLSDMGTALPTKMIEREGLTLRLRKGTEAPRRPTVTSNFRRSHNTPKTSGSAYIQVMWRCSSGSGHEHGQEGSKERIFFTGLRSRPTYPECTLF